MGLRRRHDRLLIDTKVELRKRRVFGPAAIFLGFSLSAELAEAFDLLLEAPARSEELCRVALARQEDPGARLLLAAARRLQGDFSAAASEASLVAHTHPNWAGAQFELGMALAGLGKRLEALDALAHVDRLGGLPGLWRVVGDLHFELGSPQKADQAYLRHIAWPAPEPAIHQAAMAAQRADNPAAERALRTHLAHYPNDPLALRLLAELLSGDGRFEEAANLLRRCLQRAPSFALARYGLAMVLFHDHQLAPAIEQLNLLLSSEPRRLEYLNLQAEALARAGDFDAAAACLESLLRAHPNEAMAWASYGHVLRALGRRADCERAYRRAISVRPQAGEAYWGLANLKTFAFAPSDIAAMKSHLADVAQGDEETAMLFALGKALEDQQAYEESFQTYARANAARRAMLPHDKNELADLVRRSSEVFTPEFFAARRGGRQDEDSIFVVGMPRSGSTLVEQILASHSAVEGTMELIELLAIAKRLERTGRYPELLREIGGGEFHHLGQEYLDRTRLFRRTKAPRFIDKMPNNFRQIGLIHLILPNASIVDVRRHPLACGVSNYKQHWATGQSFAYDLADIGAYYRDYVALMAHFDAALPGRVHRVIYEDLVAEPEREIRRLLEACRLPFEEGCLHFHQNTRTVRTPSSEQVRQPMFKSGLDNWRPFEPWLDPLKQELGETLTSYPAAPSSRA